MSILLYFEIVLCQRCCEGRSSVESGLAAGAIIVCRYCYISRSVLCHRCCEGRSSVESGLAAGAIIVCRYYYILRSSCVNDVVRDGAAWSRVWQQGL
ncbi:hypothetical protein J6590_105672 [Homalodisca vitripennis]|nr:hypothetical protein J6590_105672 [Homalodisca vitripennis]